MSSSVVLLALVYFLEIAVSTRALLYTFMLRNFSKRYASPSALLVFHCGLMWGRMLLYVLDGSRSNPIALPIW